LGEVSPGHFVIEQLYCELGEFGSAVAPISQAVTLGPEFAEVYFTLGLVQPNSAKMKKLPVLSRTFFSWSLLTRTLTSSSAALCTSWGRL
jgi:hypothetical protein